MSSVRKEKLIYGGRNLEQNLVHGRRSSASTGWVYLKIINLEVCAALRDKLSLEYLPNDYEIIPTVFMWPACLELFCNWEICVLVCRSGSSNNSNFWRESFLLSRRPSTENTSTCHQHFLFLHWPRDGYRSKITNLTTICFSSVKIV